MPRPSLALRVSKLRAMTAAEIAERVRYRGVLAIERAAHRRGTLAGGSSLAAALRRELQGPDWQRRLIEARRTTPARFFAGTRESEEMRRLFDGPYARQKADTVERARAARQHRFEFFGQQFAYDRDIDWQADPVTGRRWPAVYHADVPVHRGDVGYGDVKHVWELSRQQYLIDLGKSWFIEAREADVEAIERLVRSWIAGNPYATGVNWSCALEPAFRAWSWLWAYHLTADRLEPGFHVEWLRGFYDHARFLARHLEHYSSPYNHLVGEAAALYALGVLFPEFRDSNSWRRLGRAVLERRLPEQFYADGGSAEQSTFYHHATTGFYLLALLIGRANGEELDPSISRAVERALDFSLHLTQPDGRTPEIGGADDGKPIRLEHLPFWDFRPYLAIGAVLFRRADMKSVSGAFYEDALWLLGTEGLNAYRAIAPETPIATSVLLKASGYAIDRSGWSRDADYVCFDVGEQAAGMRPDGVPNSMHGHADCLSVVLWLGGRRVLVDSGLFAYNCGGAWEAHFRETAAHNTARVDGRDQAVHIGKMAWSHSYRPSLEDHFEDRSQAWTLASHDGFARGPAGVTHRRAVWRRPGGYFVVYDQFTGDGRHELEVNWQFAPGALEPVDGSRVAYDGTVHTAWQGSSNWTSEIRRGGAEPGDGWICSSLGVRQPAPRLTLLATMTNSPAALLTVFADGSRAVMSTRDADWPGAVSVSHAAGVDVIVAAGAADCRAIQTDALVAICRMDPQGAIEPMQIGGTYCRVDGALVRGSKGEHLCLR